MIGLPKFYITTAIDYVNAPCHLGHAYEKIIADVIARWHRLLGEEVFFLTGTDENAGKVQQAAQKAGQETKKFVDKMAKNFLELCKKLNISNNDFIRTTEKRHWLAAQDIFKKITKVDDIYKGKYKGLYCTACEAFYLDRELKDGLCPVHGTKPQLIEEESYFFKLSKYQQKIIDYIKANPGFIQPETKRNEIMNRLEQRLHDLSVSRFKLGWGIPVPSDPNHFIYVWFDALINYLSALGYPDEKYKKYWPADIHIVGTDINWFHSVIWPAMLFSLGIDPPKSVNVHGFVNIGGEKLSKTKGIVVDPFALIDKYGCDQLRYFLIKEAPFGEDVDFSEDGIKAKINGELAADLGNLVTRVLTLVEQFAGKIEGKPELDKQLNLKKIKAHMEKLQLHRGLEEVWSFIRATNKYINLREPWKLSGKRLANVLYNLLEALRLISILLEPFLPATAAKIREQLGVKAGKLQDAKFKSFRGKPKKGEHLFEKVK